MFPYLQDWQILAKLYDLVLCENAEGEVQFDQVLASLAKSGVQSAADIYISYLYDCGISQRCAELDDVLHRQGKQVVVHLVGDMTPFKYIDIMPIVILCTHQKLLELSPAVLRMRRGQEFHRWKCESSNFLVLQRLLEALKAVGIGYHVPHSKKDDLPRSHQLVGLSETPRNESQRCHRNTDWPGNITKDFHENI